jgi:biotin operon repressor
MDAKESILLLFVLMMLAGSFVVQAQLASVLEISRI